MSIHKKIFSILTANLLTTSIVVYTSSYSKITIQSPKLISDFERKQVEDDTDSKPLDKTLTDKQVLLNSIK